MIRINEHFLKLQASYLFADIAKRVQGSRRATRKRDHPPRYRRCHPRLAAGMHRRRCIKPWMKWPGDSTFRGYGPEQGYAFLREKIARHDFKAAAPISTPMRFSSVTAPSATPAISRSFLPPTSEWPFPIRSIRSMWTPTSWPDERAPIRTGPTRPGLPGLHRDNGYVPQLPSEPVDLIYLCFPTTPPAPPSPGRSCRRGSIMPAHKALILYDAAYEAFIRDDRLPRSIYEVGRGAGSGHRIPQFFKNRRLYRYPLRLHRRAQSLHGLHGTMAGPLRFGPVEPPARHQIQRCGLSGPTGGRSGLYARRAGPGARAGRRLSEECRLRASAFTAWDSIVWAEINSPYVWINGRRDSWAFFDLLLEKAGVVCTPGAGFGRCGQEYIRISGFNSFANVQESHGAH
jgi:LL-diaminopimelate aminotransferase